MWLLVVVLGLAMLSNVFIAVIGTEYENLSILMNDRWAEQVNLKMRRKVWNNLARKLPSDDGALNNLLKLLSEDMQPTMRGGKYGIFSGRKYGVLSGRWFSDWISDLLAFWLFRKRSKDLKMVQIDPTKARYLVEDAVDEDHGVASPRLTAGRELRKLEHKHRTESARGEWYAHVGVGSEAIQEFEGYPPCDDDWYKEEVELRFRFSWCAVPRFDDKICEHELRDDQQLDKLRYTKQHSQLVRAQIEATRKLGEISEVLLKGGEPTGRV